eukprot:CAMPEP_0171690164 /NCGR_PEP_ID=MMETSP0991-20121206/4850_1 /TAXON_ID=483369 /ORGANISM="non described non described, Strain CCMP2098" /LENGTH=544 /DNA_ID=CAMNT_0012278289 /DNA_START=82 /DNA_END=1716 /DNA_ORIENTATION=+
MKTGSLEMNAAATTLPSVSNQHELMAFFANPKLFNSSREQSPLLFSSCDQDQNTSLILAIKGGHEEAFVVLLSTHQNLDAQNVKGVTALALSAQKGRVGYLFKLLDAGAQVDLANFNGSTALIQASHFGHTDIVTLLLEHRAHVDTRNNKGTTALMRAAQEGHLPVVKQLLRQHCDVNARNEDGMNALMLGSQRGHAAIVKVLIDHSAMIDGRTVQGSTALMLSCKRGHVDVVTTLLSAGAELSIRDSKGRVAKDQASRRGEETILELLNPAKQINLMRVVARDVRTDLLKRLFFLVHGNRARVHIQLTEGSQSVRALARILGAGPAALEAQAADGVGTGIDERPFPYALFLSVLEFLPLPRLWAAEVARLERRLRIDAHDAALMGALTLIDEIFHDLSGTRLRMTNEQRLCARFARLGPRIGWLIKVASDQALQNALRQAPGAMPEAILHGVLAEHDLQSVILRHGSGITCDMAVAETIVSLCKDVHAWSCWNDVPRMYCDPKKSTSMSYSHQLPSAPAFELPLGQTSGNDESDSDESALECG